jgi:hypothetical protein
MTELQKIVSDSEISEAFKNTNFGDANPRNVVADTLIKCVCGYGTGRTALSICKELKLLTYANGSITKKGRKYLFQALKISNQ